MWGAIHWHKQMEQEAESILCFSHFTASTWDVHFIPPTALHMIVRSKSKCNFFLCPSNKGEDQERGWAVTLKAFLCRRLCFPVRLKESIFLHLGNFNSTLMSCSPATLLLWGVRGRGGRRARLLYSWCTV